MSKQSPYERSRISMESQGFNTSTRLFISNDKENICHEVSQVFKGHRLETIHSQLSAEMHHVQCERLAIGRLEYSERVSIDPGCLEDFYLFHLPLSGHVNIRYGHRQFISTINQASLISPHEAFSMIWEANSPQLTLKITNNDMLSFLHSYAGELPEKLINFTPNISLDNGTGDYFCQLIYFYINMLNNDDSVVNARYLKKQCESMLIGLMLNQQHTLMNTPAYESHLGTPGYVKKSREFIHAHLTEELTIELIAAQSGVSVRTLHNGFQHYLGISPMKYVKSQRLEGAYQDIKMANTHGITEVALKWGFSHLGRFAQEFKKRYGFLPSEAFKNQ